MNLAWQKSIRWSGLAFLFGLLGLLLGCTGTTESATAVPPNNTPTLIVFYTDN